MKVRGVDSRVLELELARRRGLGLPPHAALARWSTGALEAALDVPSVQPVGYFGSDDRRDPYVDGTLPPALLAHARRTCLIIGEAAVAHAPDGSSRLAHQHYGGFNALCAHEPFWSQPTVLERRDEAWETFGYTGYLLTPDTVLSCWHGWEHWVDRPPVAVFDYALDAGRSPIELPPERVYALEPYPVAAPAAADASGPCSGDWVVLRLVRPVSHLGAVEPPVLARASAGIPVYTLGYPRGLPLKLADRARVRRIGAGTFRADLDTYVGNSGSPVFDARSHALVGLVVAAQKDEGDFEPVPRLGCYVSNRIDRFIRGAQAVATACFASSLTPDRR